MIERASHLEVKRLVANPAAPGSPCSLPWASALAAIAGGLRSREALARGAAGVVGSAMALHLALAVAALVASAVLFFSPVSRALAILGLAASGLEVAMALGALRLHIAGIPLGLALGLALAIPGLLLWLRAASKPAVSAAAILALVGVLQVAVAVQGRI